MIPGAYTPKVEHPGHERPRFGAGSPNETAAPQGSATISGRVYGDDGRPLDGAEVSLAGSGFWPPKSVLSDDEGRFSWQRLPAGVYELRASRGNLASPPVEGILLDPGASRVFGLRLAPGWSLFGSVTDASTGRALPEARVHVAGGLLGAYARTATTDSDGKFSIRGVVGDPQTVYVEVDGYVPSGPLRATKDAPNVDIRLGRGATLTGVVVDTRGDPMQGAVVRAFGGGRERATLAGGNDSLGVTAGPVPPISSSGVRQLALAEQATTDVNGRFQLDELAAGTYSALAVYPGYAPRESEPIRLDPGTVVNDLRIVLSRGFELRGRVIDARGRGLAGIPVELRVPTERLPRMSVSGDDGRFAFLAVRGEVEVAALPYDLQPASESTVVDDGNTEVELVLSSELRTLRGRVVDERGDGIEGALVSATSVAAGGSVQRSGKSGADGTFVVPALPDPPYRLRIEHTGYSDARVDDLEDTDDVEVVLRSGVTLLGSVIDDWSSSGLGRAKVTLVGPTSHTQFTNDDGSFAFRQIPVAVYDVVITHPEYETQSQRVELERPLYVDRPQELRAVRLSPGGSIEGEVRDAYGEPVPGAQVTWEDPPNWESAARTDASGQFVLRGVPAGSVWLYARHAEAGEARSSREVTVRRLETTPAAHIRLPDRVDGAR
ncbi:MAG: carboxypeptidase-like regulatory domain-containing protein [Myxococcota bacterium]